MKELSIEEKAKAYDKVREKIAIRFGSHVADEIFSQFEMSECERIRKALIDGFTVMKESKNCGKTFSNHNIPVADILAWLEKQKDTDKLIQETYEKGYTEGQRIERKNHNGDESKKEATCVADIIDHLSEKEQEILFKELDMQKGQKSSEWSKEDKGILDGIIDAAEHHCMLTAYDIEWLKSLKPNWKPSEEQIEALRLARGYLAEKHNRDAADSLYNDLKRLW